VADLLRDEGLTRYYALADGALAPVGAEPSPRGQTWLEPLLEGAARTGGDVCALDLDVQGVHCAACVWLMGELYRRHEGALGITVNPALGKVRLTWRRGALDVAAWVCSVERFGYRFGPSRKQSAGALRGLTWRLGLSVALTMNVMLFSLSFYFGLSRGDGELFTIFSRLSLALSTGVVVVGGWPFFRAAVHGLRAGVLHLDLPIALGILLVYSTSLAELVRGKGGELTYFDTLNVFVTLMLLGRFLQGRLLERNRRLLLEDDGAEGIFVRRIARAGDGGAERVDVIPAPAVEAGERLLVAPGELVPVDAELVDAPAAISADWITGEAAPRAVAPGAVIPAGSFNAGRTALTAVARTAFAESPLGPLLRQAPARAGSGDLQFWDSLARRWVVGVLIASAAGLVLWLPRGLGHALDVAAALLVVTCPCGIGIAIPLAYEITLGRLRRAGFYARSTDLLDRLLRVRRVVFDKTGTLTLSRLELTDPATVTALAPEARDVAYNLACRSGHPVSACLAEALARAGARYASDLVVTEVAGQGVRGVRNGVEWRLGRASFALDGGEGATEGTVLARGGVPVAAFEVREALRAGAAADVEALRRAGYEPWLISGDTPARAARLAHVVGIDGDKVRAGCRPEAKAERIAALGADSVLYLGDGANDAPAFAASLCAGTVAIERPVLPARSDFFLVGESLAPLGEALVRARRLRRVVKLVLAASIAYNFFSVSVCLAGQMSPLRAAVFMPLSSLTLIGLAAVGLEPLRRAAPQGRAPVAAAETVALEPAA
jgi:Cu2+-exporting ATPase